MKRKPLNPEPAPITFEIIKYIKETPKRTVEFMGLPIIVHPDVFPVGCEFSYSSMVIAKRIPENAGYVLDVGTGTGVQAIIAAKKGAEKIVAIDIDEKAITNAYENVKYHNLENIVELRKSDLFENIYKNERFDLMIAQLPFADVDVSKYNFDLAHLLFDPGFELHEKFLNEAKNHLEKNGEILISTASIANETELLRLIDKYNYRIAGSFSEEFNEVLWKAYTLVDKND